MVSPPRLSAPCCTEAYNLLMYMIIKPDVAAEAGAGRDEANRLSSRGYGSYYKPCWLK